MRTSPTSDLWWKNAVVYCLDIETFRDADGDGCGDVAGLIERIDHVAELGATCVWLMPFYPTPGQDDGYDITDYLGVDPRLGDLGDLAEAIRHANDRGLRVLADLVVNHTSIEHPWFRAARADPASRYRDYYLWADDPSHIAGTTKDNWTYDEAAGQHYMHRFAPFQPDLNIANPAVRHEIAKTVGFWLTLGVAGFRMDAVPFLCEEVGDEDPDPDDGRRWLHALREYAGRRRGDSMLMGEVNVSSGDLAAYFEDHGDALHLQLGFLINQRLWLSLARGEAAPLEDLIRTLPVPPPDAGWATFLRNHDELTLDKLSAGERDDVFAAFGPEKDMQIYGHGIRRRVASMLGGDGPRLRMAWSLMFSLPGTPVLLYGDEIGMGEDLALEGRMSVRTPMQWAPGPAGGFSAAAAGELVRPLPGGDFGPDRVNVAAQRHSPDTLLAFMARLVRRRRETPELGFGTSTLIENDPPALFAHRCDWQGSTVFAVHNLSGERAAAELDLGEDVEGVDDLLEEREHRVRGGRLRVELDAYGYLWLRARRA
jgi:trehalose synthase